ncbi:Site-specific DNA recombinase [Thermoactinomyces sp. DSM 45892]|nr:Site-specific DNA recombinase [Thermoactinomyces sp. DSM 45892]
MAVFGYARVSTDHQDIKLQIDELNKYGVDIIYQEIVSGKNLDDRHELQKLIHITQSGDKIVFTKLDRFARSTIDALTVAQELKKKGVSMVILNFAGAQIDVSTPTGKLFLTQLASFAEFERELMLERQKAGIAQAKADGKYKGRVKKYHEHHKGMNYAVELANERDQNKMTIDAICEITQVSRAALYRELKKQRKHPK